MKVLENSNQWNHYPTGTFVGVDCGVLTILDENSKVVAIYNVNEWKRVVSKNG